MESAKKASELNILSQMREGSNVTIGKIDSGMSLRRRLAELGIYPGETVKILRNSSRGPVLLLVKNSTIMLGRGMAQKIYANNHT